MTKIDGKTPTTINAALAAKLKAGVPKRTALSTVQKPKSMVKV